MTRIGILAYGSLTLDPKWEIEELAVYPRDGVLTSFKVEFARKSDTRGGAPTLVPVRKGGDYVSAVIYVLREGTTFKQACDVLYRREIHEVGTDATYQPGLRPGQKFGDKVRVKTLKNRYELDTVLYTAISPTIRNRSPEKLARLAIASTKTSAVEQGLDGITYLIQVKRAGVKTPLLPAYERCICRFLGVENLEEAHRRFVKKFGQKRDQ